MLQIVQHAGAADAAGLLGNDDRLDGNGIDGQLAQPLELIADTIGDIGEVQQLETLAADLIEQPRFPALDTDGGIIHGRARHHRSREFVLIRRIER